MKRFPGANPLAGLLALAMLTLASCATPSGKGTKEHPSSIGPFPQFTGRLIVIEPTRRWQVLVNWQADSRRQGWLRLTHAATGRVVELKWLHQRMLVRDDSHPEWQEVSRQALAEEGIVIPPQQLAAILLGTMPPHFRRKNGTTWEGKQNGGLIRLEWKAEQKRLSMTDMTHGRTATLLIQP